LQEKQYNLAQVMCFFVSLAYVIRKRQSFMVLVAGFGRKDLDSTGGRTWMMEFDFSGDIVMGIQGTHPHATPSKK